VSGILLYIVGVRGVGFISSPLLNQKGVINQQLFHITDWMPTLLHLAGGDYFKLNLDGINQWEPLKTGSGNPRKVGVSNESHSIFLTS